MIERKRHKHEIDSMQWYCSKCHEVVFRESFHCVDLGECHEWADRVRNEGVF